MEGEGERENEGINTIILFVRCLVATGVGTAYSLAVNKEGGVQSSMSLVHFPARNTTNNKQPCHRKPQLHSYTQFQVTRHCPNDISPLCLP